MAKKDDSDARKMFESKYDENKLRKMIKGGNSASEIKEALGIATMQSLRQHVMRLINTDRAFYDVPGLYVRGQKLPQINFKGELRLTPKMMQFEDSTYKHGDKFEVEIDNEKIILRRIETQAGTEEFEEPDAEVKEEPEEE